MEKLDKERYLKRVIVVCWIALAICFGIKLFGGNLFEIMCNNENFIKVCEYADNHFLVYYFLIFTNSFALSYFFYLAISGNTKYKKWQLYTLIITTAIGVPLKTFNTIGGMIFDIWQAIIMPCLFTIKSPKKHWNVVIGNVLVLIFQLVSMFTKNIGIKVITSEGTLTMLIFSIDVFLMVLLYYLYSISIRKKGDCENGC